MVVSASMRTNPSSLVCRFVTLGLLFVVGCGVERAPDTSGGPTTLDTGNDAGLSFDLSADRERNDTGPRDRQCTNDRECAGGEVCYHGVCLETCSSERPCEGALRECAEDLGICVECTSRDHCGANETCFEFACVESCSDDSDCLGGQVCDARFDVCAEMVCSEVGDCSDADRCIDGLCIPLESIVCEPGSSWCEENQLSMCGRFGTTATYTDCSADRCIEDDGGAECLPTVCESGVPGCADNSVVACSDDGTALVEVEPCGDLLCIEIPCLAESSDCVGAVCSRVDCVDHTADCEGDWLIECGDEPGDLLVTDCAGDDHFCGEGEDGLACVECTEHDHCADDDACTDDVCIAGTCTSNPVDCDDGDRCNGVELCEPVDGCYPGLPADFDHDDVPDADDPDPPDVDGDGITDCADWETCDGLDNDRNGVIDDGPEDPELGGDCYTGPGDTAGVGQCRPGTTICHWGELDCFGQVLPAADEYCDGRDNDCDGEVPDWESTELCSGETELSSSSAPTRLRVELPISLERIDIQLNLDSTGSMSGAIENLRTSFADDIAPTLARSFPSVAFGVSTFEDYPVSSFGSGGDLPFELHQRITTMGPAVAAALNGISLGSGNDIPEAGIESLYQIATGAGTAWPLGGPSTDELGENYGFLGEIRPAGDVDFFQINAEAGDYIDIDIDASRIGASIDSYLELYDSTGRLLGFNDDADGLDPALAMSLTGEPPFLLKIRGLFSTSQGWYYARVTAGGDKLLPAENDCSALEVGLDVFDETGSAILLIAVEEALPRPDPSACMEDCMSLFDEGTGDPWLWAHCWREALETCGNGTVEAPEECDDGNRTSGDGCSAYCAIEVMPVPAFEPDEGFDPAQGHGRLGGVGFRENSLPVILHVTDAPSHAPEDYVEADLGIEAHTIDDTFEALATLGARIVGLAARTPSGADLDDPLNPPGMAFLTSSMVPPCAFDGTEPRETGRCAPDLCCTSSNGAGLEPSDDTGGLCVLSMRFEGNGDWAAEGAAIAVEALLEHGQFRISPSLGSPPSNPADSTCFVQSIEAEAVTPIDACGVEIELSDEDGDGADETILNGPPTGTVTYSLLLANRDGRDIDDDLITDEICGPPGRYELTFDVVLDEVVTVAHHEIVFEVLDD